jgi:hypothetical protein
MYRRLCREALVCVLLMSISIGMAYSVTAVAAGSGQKVGSPGVVQVYPSHGMDNVPVDTSIHVVFDEPMDETSTISAISISPTPELSYSTSWQFLHNNSVLVITPAPIKRRPLAIPPMTRNEINASNGIIYHDSPCIEHPASHKLQSKEEPRITVPGRCRGSKTLPHKLFLRFLLSHGMTVVRPSSYISPWHDCSSLESRLTQLK